MLNNYQLLSERNYNIEKRNVVLEEVSGIDVVILGVFHSVFAIQLACELEQRELSVAIITTDPSSTGVLSNGIRVLSVLDYEPHWIRRLGRVLHKLGRLEKRILGKLYHKRINFYLRNYSKSQSALLSIIARSISVCWLVNQIKPKALYGQQVERYGLATALCRHQKRLLMPFGQDIYNFCLATPMHRFFTAYFLNCIDLVVPASLGAISHIRETFDVSESRIKFLSWGVDRSLFFKRSPDENAVLMSKYGIADGAQVIMNVRRFRPAWGSKIALEVFVGLAKRRENVHFIIVGDCDSDSEIRAAITAINENNITAKFTILEGGVSLKEFAELLSVSTISLSLMQDFDMRSSSILQAVASGTVPILSDQLEYRLMQRQGLRAVFVNHDSNADEIMDIIDRLLDESDLVKYLMENQSFISEYEDAEKCFDRIADEIRFLVGRE